MPDPRFIALRALLEQDHLEEACEHLVAAARAIDADRVTEARATRGRLAAEAKKKASGTIAEETTRVERNNIRLSLYEQIDRLERSLHRTGGIVEEVIVSSMEGSPKKYLGASLVRSTAWWGQGIARSRVVCRVVSGAWCGTGFLISGGRVLTCKHVLSSMIAGDAATIAFERDADDNSTDDNSSEASDEYRAVQGSWRASETLDAALVKVVDDPLRPLSRRGLLDLELTSTPLHGDTVTFIGYPDGGAQKMSTIPGLVVRSHGGKLYYTLETVPGVSGSPIFNESWRVVAVHAEGGDEVELVPSGNKVLVNEGLLIKLIWEDLLVG